MNPKDFTPEASHTYYEQLNIAAYYRRSAAFIARDLLDFQKRILIGLQVKERARNGAPSREANIVPFPHKEPRSCEA